MHGDLDKTEQFLPYHQRILYFAPGVALYTLVVAGFLQSRDLSHDMAGCASFHASQYSLIFMSGLGIGIAMGPSVVFGIRTLIRNMRATLSEDIEPTLRKLAWGALVLGMIPSLLWVVPSFNVFIDIHQGLVVEADMLVTLMGLITGVSWLVLLKGRPWIGVLISSSMVLMLVSSILTRYGWC